MKPFRFLLIVVIMLSAGAPAGASNKLYNFDYFLNQPYPLAVPPITPPVVAPMVAPPVYGIPAAVAPAPAPQTAAVTVDDDERWLEGGYVTLNLFGGRSFVKDHEYTGGTGLVARGDVDWVGGNSVAGGYSWEEFGVPIRTELEGGVRYRFDLNYRGTVAGVVRGYTNEVATIYGMVNGYYDIDFDWNWVPYLGAGVGMARHWSQSVRKNFPGITNKSTQDARTNALTWALMGGVTYNWNRNWAGKIEGRYWDLGEVVSGPFANNDKITGQYTTYDLVLGITYYP